MKVNFYTSDEKIIVKCIDEHFNVYRCEIEQSDPFVDNFCSRNLRKFEKILKNYKLEEQEDKIILKIEIPIELKYILRKEKKPEGEALSMILGKLSNMEEEIIKLKSRTRNLEEQLENGVILPGYAGGVISKNTTELLLGVKKEYDNPDFRTTFHSMTGQDKDNFYTNRGDVIFYDFNNHDFSGKSIKAVSFLNELNIFALHYNQLVDDFSPLGNCPLLRELYFNSCNISNIDFTRNLKFLQKISFVNCPKVRDLSPLLDCHLLQEIYFQNCNNIQHLPKFSKNVEINYKD